MADIYGLYDRAGNLRYIGKANDVGARLKSHMRDARRRHTPLYCWLRKHGKPEVRVLESGLAEWREAERRLIAQARARGDRLLNIADGGDEPHCPPEIRRKNALMLGERLRSNPELARIRDLKRGLSKAINQGYLSNARRACLRDRARAMPAFLGAFANIPDRQEDDLGRAWVKVGNHRVQVG